MRLRALPVLAFLLMLLPACQSEEPREEKNVPKNLILLRNEHIEVGIFPKLGGRIVLLRRPGGVNVLLDAHQELLDAGDEKLPKPAAGGNFAGEGHIVWIGPQQDWWRYQELHAERRKQCPGWPPDPWIECGRFEVREQDAQHVLMVGPASPITGLQLTKRVTLDGKRVQFTVTAKNTRDSEVAWDLWTNMRMPAQARGFAPMKKDESVRYEFISGQLATEQAIDLRQVNGFAYFDLPKKLPDGIEVIRGKAFMNCRSGIAAGFWKDSVLIKRTVDVAQEKDVHPEQAVVEIYQALTRTGTGSLLELEFHGPYVKLKPGDEMSFAETWEVHPYEGADTPEAQSAYLKEVLK